MANFALGLKFGVDAGSRIVDNLYRAEEQDRKRQQWKREDDIRAAAGNTLGNVGTSREDGSVYDEEQALRDYSSRIAGTDPEKALQASRGAEEVGLRRMQRRAAERQARYEDYAEDVLKARRAIAGGANALEVFRGLATKFNSVTDGRYAGVTEDGQGLTLFDASSGTTKVVPFSPENVMKAIDGMHALASPKAMENARNVGLKEREVKAKEDTAATARQHREDQRPLLAAQATRETAYANYLNRRGAGGDSYTPSFSQAGTLTDGTPVVFNNRTGRYQNGRTGGELTDDQIKLFNRVTGDRPSPAPKLTALGSTGLLTDGSRAFRLDERTNQLVEVSMPGGARDLRVPPPPGAGGPRAGATPQPMGPEPFRSTGQQTFGLLTPESTIQYEAAGGNPAAVEYLRRRDAARLEDELYRARGGLGQLGIAP